MKSPPVQAPSATVVPCAAVPAKAAPMTATPVGTATAETEPAKLLSYDELVASISKTCIIKACLVFGKNGDNSDEEQDRMGAREMKLFAAACKFPSDDKAWEQDFWRICENYGMSSEKGLTEDQFVDVVKGGDSWPR